MIRMSKDDKRNGNCPQAGYDQVGQSHYCLDCSRQWFGENCPCRNRDCPFHDKPTGERR